MGNTAGLSRILFATEILIACSLMSSGAAAQTAGNNAVADVTGTCSVSSCAFSSAFIDAYVVLNGVPPDLDLCDTIYHILKSATYSPSVIDARGISGSALTCTQGSPWNESGAYLYNKASVILLPPGVITTSVPWVIPANTKLIGTAKGSSSLVGSGYYVIETTIQASSSFSGTAMVKFGDSHCSGPCQGISVEHLTIAGVSNAVNGIENDNCSISCYVEHVTILGVLGMLKTSVSAASDSGPYSNIRFDLGTTAAESIASHPNSAKYAELEWGALFLFTPDRCD